MTDKRVYIAQTLNVDTVGHKGDYLKDHLEHLNMIDQRIYIAQSLNGDTVGYKGDYLKDHLEHINMIDYKDIHSTVFKW